MQSQVGFVRLARIMRHMQGRMGQYHSSLLGSKCSGKQSNRTRGAVGNATRVQDIRTGRLLEGAQGGTNLTIRATRMFRLNVDFGEKVLRS